MYRDLLEEEPLPSKSSGFRLVGTWWPKDRPDAQQPGQLECIRDKGSILEVLNGLGKEGLDYVPLVHGKTIQAEQVTACGCSSVGFATSYERGRYKSAYTVELLVLGGHYPERDRILFREITVDYSSLWHWVGAQLFETPALWPSSSLDAPWTVTVHPLRNIELFSGPSYRLLLNYGGNIRTTGDNWTFCLKPYAHVQCVFHKPASFDQYLPIIKSFRDFLTFATLRATGVDKITAPLPTPAMFQGDRACLYHRDLLASAVADSINNPLFRVADTAGCQVLLNNWFTKAEKLQPAVDWYLLTRYTPRMHEDIAFLCLVHAIEAYHRRNKANEKIPAEEHQRRLAAVKASAPQEHRRWLLSKLAYSNEPSLRNRLEALLHELGPIVSNFTIPEQFIEDVVTKRNYLVHSPPERADKVLKKETYRLSESIEFLLGACILTELGMGAQAVTSVLHKAHTLLRKRYGRD